MITHFRDFFRGIYAENPVFVQLLGMCPTLAVTNTAINGMSMGLMTTFVLASSGIIISLIKNLIPKKVRIPSYIVIIATFVTMVDLFGAAYVPDVHRTLGLFIPLIVVNCLILGRAEAFASRRPVHRTIFDALGMGLGFTLSLTVLGMVREIFAFGSLFGRGMTPDGFVTWGIMALPPGAFLSLGLLIGLLNMVMQRKEA